MALGYAGNHQEQAISSNITTTGWLGLASKQNFLILQLQSRGELEKILDM
jgi:hypothetical protein